MSPPIVTSLLKLAQLTPSDHLIDIGCGDGRVVLSAAESFGCTSTGLELEPSVAELAARKVQQANMQHRVQIVQIDARKADLNKATAISLYLSERGNSSLLPLLTPWLLSSAPSASNRRVVSFMFPIASWTPTKIELTESGAIPMYLFTRDSLPEKSRKKYAALQQAEEEKKKHKETSTH